MPEQAVFVVVNENLELACSVLEKGAAEKALPDIDEQLTSLFANRRKHREVWTVVNLHVANIQV